MYDVGHGPRVVAVGAINALERKSEPRAAAKDKQLFRATPGCASKRAQCQRHPDRGTGGGRTLPISATIARIPSSST